jgi:hypothetical protein
MPCRCCRGRAMDLDEERRRKLAWLRKHQPERYREIIDVLFEVERRAKRAEYERSFSAFVRRFWSEVDPAELRLAWFHECLIEHLEAVCRGEIRSLLCNLPPRVGKSLIVSVLYPSWIWARASVAPQSGPQVSFLLVQYQGYRGGQSFSRHRPPQPSGMSTSGVSRRLEMDSRWRADRLDPIAARYQYTGPIVSDTAAWRRMAGCRATNTDCLDALSLWRGSAVFRLSGYRRWNCL